MFAGRAAQWQCLQSKAAFVKTVCRAMSEQSSVADPGDSHCVRWSQTRRNPVSHHGSRSMRRLRSSDITLLALFIEYLCVASQQGTRPFQSALADVYFFTSKLLVALGLLGAFHFSWCLFFPCATMQQLVDHPNSHTIPNLGPMCSPSQRTELHRRSIRTRSAQLWRTDP